MKDLPNKLWASCKATHLRMIRLHQLFLKWKMFRGQWVKTQGKEYIWACAQWEIWDKNVFVYSSKYNWQGIVLNKWENPKYYFHSILIQQKFRPSRIQFWLYKFLKNFKNNSVQIFFCVFGICWVASMNEEDLEHIFQGQLYLGLVFPHFLNLLCVTHPVIP